ncbi:hypothetical protein SOVF_203920 isoform B [Spinacia oleracea]|uniref:Uncharacterized protein isoform X2 n=1 Tax=Spinacia oleracea TaxID=3562 RepID=A0A9R0K532_SPIOL|nr:uncharacterized protein LOC110797045 isoform X2 [Spinacia oleracea]KNA03989.1 hypothetical protein SOVF_203920 isoform B [Spinacia oleracea]
MTSSTITGDRRWSSARRGGMTVLGKVAVPKPINLPSKRLENHGLDPNVKIVPKGTLKWGSRPSSSGSNAWGTSALSPTTDMPHMPHVPHLQPGMPMRPVFYPSRVHCDGYYRPPKGFCNTNERDFPLMGMPAGPPIYNRHANQNAPDKNNAHPRSREGRGPEQVEPGHPQDPRGHFKVLGHPNDSWARSEEEKLGHSGTITREKGTLSKAPVLENAWEDDYKKDEGGHYGKSATKENYKKDEGVHYGKSATKEVASCFDNKFAKRLSNIDETQISPTTENEVSPQDHSLIQKIEGLNAKTHSTSQKEEGFHREGPNDRVQMINVKDYRSANEANPDVDLERHHPTGVRVPVSRSKDVLAADRSRESSVAPRWASARKGDLAVLGKVAAPKPINLPSQRLENHGLDSNVKVVPKWASARRGDMAVLGKVSVPKPINLPSQRLENHGLDPNVEIVPKWASARREGMTVLGKVSVPKPVNLPSQRSTLSWGSRPSSSGSNAWGTSALSPTTDGSRPSTAGSDRAHDSNGNTWGSSSRPSSSSGVLASNHASSISLRPYSADTRPGSSHLSRFAEPALEGPGVWGTNSASERVGVASSANGEFSLTSGDFQTLGSEKDESNMDMEPLDRASHGRPGSSGGMRTMTDGRGIAHGDDISRNSDVKGNSWRNDGPPFVEDGPRPNMERWHGDPYLYPNYESWRGAPPVNPPGGGWYRGPPGPPPYGGPVPPGGFPVEPFSYYHPQVPAHGLASSQPMPPGAGHPGMPMRPGFYPSPVHYDGYYRPPMGFCNPNERDSPFMGMPAGPPIYNRHANQNAPDQNNGHPRAREGRGHEQVVSGHPHESRGHFKVLGHPNDSWSQNEEEKWGHRGTITRENGILSKAPVQENAWEDDYKKDDGVQYGKSATKEVASRFDNKFASNPSSGKFPERLSNIDETQISPTMENVVSPKDHSLIQKIEGLNANTCSSRRKEEGFHRVGPNDRVQVINAKDYRSANETNSDVVLEHHHPTGVRVPLSRSEDVSAADRSRESSDSPRRSVRGPQSRGDSHSKGGFHGQDADVWGKKSDFPSLQAASRSVANNQVGQHNAAVQTDKPSRTNVKAKGDGESNVSSIDPSDMQRAKMREIAKQRAIQLQKEEEERVREQKAKALAKLEELNRRSATANKGVENPNQREPIPPPGDVPKKQDVSSNQSGSSVDANHGTGSFSASPNNVPQINERSASKIMDSVVSSSHLVAETKRSSYQEAKMREIAKPCEIQLQKEEEEQVREHKAKALAKLEELNKRSANHGVENPNQREPIPPPGDVPKKQDVSRNQSDSSVDANHGTGSSSASPNNVAQINERSASKITDSAVSSSHLVAEAKRSAYQEAKMREIAKQRANQLQKEEEEQVREQKAKALAKLEELNRRSANQSVENPNQREPIPPPGDVPKKDDVSRNQSDSSVDANHCTGSSSASPNNVAQINERSASKIMDSAVSSSHLVAETKRSAYHEASFSSQNQLPTADINVDDDASHRTAPQVCEVSKQEQGGKKQRQSVPPEKNSVQDTIPAGRTDVLMDLKVASTTREVTGSFVDSGVGKEQAESPFTADSPVQKKKIHKTWKNIHKVEESSTAVSSPVTQPEDSNLAQAIPKSAEQSCSSLPVNSLSMQLSADPKDVTQSSENPSSLSREDTHARVNSAWKAQQSRKPLLNNRASESRVGPSSSHSSINVKDSSRPTAQSQFPGGRGRRFAFTATNPCARSSSFPNEASRSDTNGFQRKPRRGPQRLEFRVRQTADEKQSSALPSSSYSGLDAKLNCVGKGNTTLPESGLNNYSASGKPKQSVDSEISVSAQIQETGSGTKVDKTALNETAATSGIHTSQRGAGSLKRNIDSEDDVDAPLQSGIVRIFKQPGIEAPSDEDDFIEVRSKRQMLNDRREQREKEIKEKSSNMRKAQRKSRPAAQVTASATARSTNIARSTNRTAAPLNAQATKNSHSVVTSERGLLNNDVSATLNGVGSQSLAPIGTPPIGADCQTDGEAQTVNLPQTSSYLDSGKTVGTDVPDPAFDAQRKVVDGVQSSIGSWGGPSINQPAQLEEAMKPGHFDTHVITFGDRGSSVNDPGMPSSSVLAKDGPFSSATNPINSLLAGEKIQFGAITFTSPTIFPPSTHVSHIIRPPASLPLDVQSPQTMSASQNNCDVLFEKEKHPNESCSPSEDCEAEAAASAVAVAVAAISNDEVVGNGIGSCSTAISVPQSFGGANINRIVTGISGDQHAASQSKSKAEETLSVSLPADLSVETPPISIWLPLPSPHGSSSHMLSPFPGGPASHFPYYDMNPMMGGPVFAFGPHEESAQAQSQKSSAQKSSASSSGPLGTWQQCHTGVDSFYGTPAGFTAPFISPPGSIPGVQGPPHMVVYNHFAPVGQFGQVGLSYMGTTYIPSGKQPDWKRNSATVLGCSEGEMNNTNLVPVQPNAPNIPAQVQHLAPGSPLLSMASPLAMFELSPFQSSPDVSVHPHWPHVQPSVQTVPQSMPLQQQPEGVHTVPQSMPLQQQPESAVPSQSSHGSTDHHLLNTNGFSKPQISSSLEDCRSFANAAATQLPNELGLLNQPISNGSEASALPVGSNSRSRDSVEVDASAESSRSKRTPHVAISAPNKAQAQAQSTRQKNTSAQQQNHHHHHHQRGGGQKNGYGAEWSNRKMGFHGRNHPSGGDRGFPPAKVKQIYVAKQNNSSGTGTGSAV